MDATEILQGLSYKVCSTILPIFSHLAYLFLVFGISAPPYTNSLLLCYEDILMIYQETLDTRRAHQVPMGIISARFQDLID